MTAFWSGSVASFLRTDPAEIRSVLTEAQVRHFRNFETTQLRAWDITIDALRTALLAHPEANEWWVLLEYPMLRLGRRADAIVLTGHAIIVLEFKAGATWYAAADLIQAEDFALDLQDFHAASRHHPIIPVLVATDAKAGRADLPLLLAAVSEVMTTNAADLRECLWRIARWARPLERFDPAEWAAAPYRPVPTIVEAACMLYGRNGVAEIAAARADATNLTRTTQAIEGAIASARDSEQHIIVFVTGIPGAGKTLCGLNAAFGASATRGTFLTGNPALVHVLSEALARDASAQVGPRLARQQIGGAIQALPKFRDYYVAHPGEVPAETVVVIDEAQRSWSQSHAIRKTLDRPVRLTASEPAHLLDIMARHRGFAAIICLLGGGQEIHDGEGGLAEWGAALATRPDWNIAAPPQTLTASDPRQKLPPLPKMELQPALHLEVSIRQIRSEAAAAWVDALLLGEVGQAAKIAAEEGPIPFRITRDLDAMRAALRAAVRGTRRCGLVASSGARRLRAEGLGVELAHMDAKAVARWFLDHWPDVRASDALEVVATEFSVQGLELDHVGLCWDGDLVREHGRREWRVRAFRGTNWTTPRGAEAIANQINTYRVLLTRARYATIIFVPKGDASDATRDPAMFDAIADFLQRCGASALEEGDTEFAPNLVQSSAEPALL